jgi:hypothetical protein
MAYPKEGMEVLGIVVDNGAETDKKQSGACRVYIPSQYSNEFTLDKLPLIPRIGGAGNDSVISFDASIEPGTCVRVVKETGQAGSSIGYITGVIRNETQSDLEFPGNVGIDWHNMVKQAKELRLDIQTKAKAGSGVESLDTLSIRITGTTAVGDALNVKFLNGTNVNIATISALLGADNVAYGTLTFSTRNYNTDSLVEAMRVTNRGDVCVRATVSSYSAVGRGNITIGGTAGVSAILATQIGGTARGYFYCNPDDLYIDNYTGTGAVVVFNGTGGVQLTRNATAWSSYSDERLKNVNSNINDALNKILTLRAVNFSWKTDSENKENFGLIAQDVEKVFPQVIDKSKLPSKPTEEQTDETEYLSVKYTELIPVLVKAIQELKSENDTLKEILQRNNIQ